MNNKTIILILGACGQIGRELTVALREIHGTSHVIASDRYANRTDVPNYMQIDVLDGERLKHVVKQHGVTQIYLLAAMLSAKGEQDANAAWNLNMQSLITVLNIARDEKLDKVFWPSSIAVFGPRSLKFNCPQETRTDPETVYGISKRAGEYWCNYYYEKYGVDVRSLRLPGLISASAPTGGGTTNYAVNIFHEAIKHQYFECYLEESTVLPMLYMKDAIRAIIKIMSAPSEKIKVRTAYNLGGISFAPCDLAAEIRKYIPDLKVVYQPDHRQVIANSWPASMDDSGARNDWGWAHEYNMAAMASAMFESLKAIKKPSLDHYPEFLIEDVAAI
ncbi:NAD-dependent epimerase/dehydratase family protein [Mucilaginibacter aquariorum]|uniref:NAD-dependent epimerase/dehydratase family protein n=1 Tax=Mucilaginibacter aquariorum TaxID=2967225 RepID=A0ABT1SXC5_9SPHI|nr:NAD-dependent epimerase/dehydratase family protein [Mucilaginibacter aquariorum]MCQ6956994.1 NAD-dependent epimerase/dehydratase family protein [Mucilaginibacter aquariorum]